MLKFFYKLLVYILVSETIYFDMHLSRIQNVGVWNIYFIFHHTDIGDGRDLVEEIRRGCDSPSAVEGGH